MSGVAPMQAKDVLKVVGIQERKLRDGKAVSYIVAQNTALRIASVFMLCCAVLVLLWVQSSEEAATRRSQVLEEQIMAKNHERLETLQTAKASIEAQAFAKQNLRVLRQVKIGTAKLYRVFNDYERKAGGQSTHAKALVGKARSYLATMQQVIDADRKESSSKFDKATAKTSKLLKTQAQAAKHPNWLTKRLRAAMEKRARGWQSKLRNKRKEARPLGGVAMDAMDGSSMGQMPPLMPSPDALKVKLPTFKESKEAGELDKTPAPTPPGKKAQQKSNRQQMKAQNLDLQRKLHRVFSRAKAQKLLSIPEYKLSGWKRIAANYKALLKQDVSKGDVQRKMAKLEREMKASIHKPKLRGHAREAWDKAVDKNVFSVFNSQLRMAGFAKAQAQVKAIEAKLNKNELTTVDAWSQIMGLMRSGELPPGWANEHRMFHMPPFTTFGKHHPFGKKRGWGASPSSR